MHTITASTSLSKKLATCIASAVIMFAGLAVAFAIVLPVTQLPTTTVLMLMCFPLAASFGFSLHVCELTNTKPEGIKCSVFCAAVIVVIAILMTSVHGMGF